MVILAVMVGMAAQAQNSEPTNREPRVAADATVVNSHSAEKALRLSLLPGAGQIYNRQAWKVPIIYGAFAGMGYLIYSNYNTMATYRDEYLYRIQHNGEPLSEEYANIPNTNIYNLYQSNNKNFQLMIIITAGIYGLNLVDAYVFGHLFDFQINEDLSMSVSPLVTPITTNRQLSLAPTLGISLRF